MRWRCGCGRLSMLSATRSITSSRRPALCSTASHIPHSAHKAWYGYMPIFGGRVDSIGGLFLVCSTPTHRCSFSFLSYGHRAEFGGRPCLRAPRTIDWVMIKASNGREERWGHTRGASKVRIHHNRPAEGLSRDKVSRAYRVSSGIEWVSTVTILESTESFCDLIPSAGMVSGHFRVPVVLIAHAREM